MGCFGLTEPSAGSDPAAMLTTARADGPDHYILNGQKAWITGSPIADLAVIWAKVLTALNDYMHASSRLCSTGRHMLACLS